LGWLPHFNLNRAETGNLSEFFEEIEIGEGTGFIADLRRCWTYRGMISEGAAGSYVGTSRIKIWWIPD
jgi:hypothetical protein